MQPDYTAQKAALRKQLNSIEQKEQKALAEKHYPKFKAFEGRFFKVKNTYGGKCKGWWLYTKVIEVKPKDIYTTGGDYPHCQFKGWTFQKSSDGTVTIEFDRQSFIGNLGNEITENEFNEAWNALMSKIDNLK